MERVNSSKKIDPAEVVAAGESCNSIAGTREVVTLRSLLRSTRTGERFACLTCYDATTARWLQHAGVPLLLVGDTAGEIVLGHPATIHTPLEFLITLTAAVKRGAPQTLVMADMPFMSYQADDAEGVRNAGRFLVEGMADLVKLEVDQSFAPLVAKMTRAGIPVVAHIGSRPQHAKAHGGYFAAGKSAAQAHQLLEDAKSMIEAGALMLLVEACPEEVTAEIVRRSTVPVIGCGAGSSCQGQVVVLHDLLGLTNWQPAFAQPEVHMGQQIAEAASAWIERVKSGALGEHPYAMPETERARFMSSLRTPAADVRR
ncbi:MAG: 3-methyl-2-oxobutanoate hydroxymethyltransferase [Phycisphaerales bacterium]|nr:3-methyl-2-oxobutanoate hydroxymethyltransferase [Phycisphaerales bacterium]